MKIIIHPDPLLRTKCKPIKHLNQKIQRVAYRMLHTMYSKGGIGLSANQVGLKFKIFTMNKTGDKKNKKCEYVFINPVINDSYFYEYDIAQTISQETCLSIPGYTGFVERYKSVHFSAMDINGHRNFYLFHGLEARIVAHECDHLLGILFIDRIKIC